MTEYRSGEIVRILTKCMEGDLFAKLHVVVVPNRLGGIAYYGTLLDNCGNSINIIRLEPQEFCKISDEQRMMLELQYG